MKFLIVLSVFIAAAFAALDPEFIAQTKEQMQKIAAECITETGVSIEEVTKMKSKNAPNTHEGKCFIACFQKHLDIMNASGKLDKVSGLKHLEQFKDVDAEMYGKAVEMLEKCFDATPDEDDQCETALNFVVCIKTTAEQMGLNCELFD